MIKIEKISSFQPFLPGYLPKALEQHYQGFKQSELGRIYQAIPWENIEKSLKIKKSKKGPQTIFSYQGQISLMFLKAYSGLSDRKLIEQLNGNIDYQYFCGICLKPGQRITNYKIVSQIRCQLSEKLKIEEVQTILAKYWKPYITTPSKILIDATCYESSVRYPTNQKLLWESVNILYADVKYLSKKVGIRLIRTKYNDWRARYNEYARKRRKSRKEKRAITRALLKLLAKLDGCLDQLEKKFEIEQQEKYQKQRKIIKTILVQQKQIFETGESVPGRIVSISKSYLRPIVRGKEVKKVEFGAKVNKIQIDGINFIQTLSFDPFNEGTKFQASVTQAQQLTKMKVRQVGADAIYASNKNRKFATSEGIQTDFVRKGRAGKNEEERKKISKELRKQRASFLEGSFGNEKEHYSLKKINARTEKTERLWIFIGIHTANAVQIGHRMAAARLFSQAA